MCRPNVILILFFILAYRKCGRTRPLQHLAQWNRAFLAIGIARIYQQLKPYQIHVWISVAVDVLLQEQENPDFIEPGRAQVLQVVGATGPSLPPVGAHAQLGRFSPKWESTLPYGRTFLQILCSSWKHSPIWENSFENLADLTQSLP